MTTNRTKLLVSVRSRAEAQDALIAGTHVIDVKEPPRGPLGMADQAVIEQVCDVVHDRCCVSAALGELVEAVTIKLPITLRYAKIGLADAPDDWRDRLKHLRHEIAPAGLIAVAYADHKQVGAPSVCDVLDWACSHGVAGVLIDTATKSAGGLFDWIDTTLLDQWTRRVQGVGMVMALAGALRGDAFAKAIELKPDIVAVRGAACVDNNRLGPISRRRVQALATLVESHNALLAVSAD